MSAFSFAKLRETLKSSNAEPVRMDSTAKKVAKCDSRIDAFCSRQGPEIFRPVAFPTDVWLPDPLDVEAIHAHARDAFNVLLDKATKPDDPGKVGRILLLLGEAGSGKTHLMRAFRTRAHRQGSGYFGYMQMTSSSGNYGRYVLRKLIESLDEPYYCTYSDTDTTTGLRRLSTAVAESPMIPKWRLEELREGGLGLDETAALVLELADEVVCDPRLHDVPIDLLMAMLFLQSEHPGLRNYTMKYLRAESLSEHDRTRLAGITPLDSDDSAQVMIERLAHLMWTVQGASLILCVDQLEDIAIQDGAAEQFPRAMNCLIQIAQQVPSSVIVISCLEDYYDALKHHLCSSAVDRIIEDPQPLRLQGGRTWDEIKGIVELHLSHLYDYFDLSVDSDDPTFPIPDELLRENVQRTTRVVLSACKAYREKCIRERCLVSPQPLATNAQVALPNLDGEKARLSLDQAWNDHLVNSEIRLPDDDEGLAVLLATSIELCSDEIEFGGRFETSTDELWVTIRVSVDGESRPARLAGICNKSPGGGNLGKQIQAMLDHTSQGINEATPIVVRSSEFTPKNPKSLIATIFAQLVTRGGQSVHVPDSAWRAMAAMQSFRTQHLSDSRFSEWLRHSMPLTRLESLRKILDLDSLQNSCPTLDSVDESPVESLAVEPADSFVPADVIPRSEGTVNWKTLSMPPSVSESSTPSGELTIGSARNRSQSQVTLRTGDLTKHVAFLGSTGSGKTTAALNVIEQLVVQGIPVLLVDRKGDLVSYARKEIWQEHADDPRLGERQRLLRERMDVAVYTPGNSSGRTIRLPVAPDHLGKMDEADLKHSAGAAARSLGQMMGYKENGKGAKQICVLIQAIELMARLGYANITLNGLIEYINEKDDALISALGVLNVKVIDVVLQDLQALLITKQHLFPSNGEPLCAEELLGLNGTSPSGRTRLSVISTKFLGDQANVQFWVAQLLLELSRWANKSPSGKLQAVVMFDEADMYLPATSKPACKEPMEGLLKRARSAGLCMMLASQSPGDFDYNCRENINTWFVGKIKEKPAIEKMKAMLSEVKRDISAELAGQKTGEFYLVSNATPTAVCSDRSFVATRQIAEQEILRLARQGIGVPVSLPTELQVT